MNTAMLNLPDTQQSKAYLKEERARATDSRIRRTRKEGKSGL